MDNIKDVSESSCDAFNEALTKKGRSTIAKQNEARKRIELLREEKQLKRLLSLDDSLFEDFENEVGD